MSLIDLILLIFLGGFILAGFWLGIVHMVGSTIGVILGAFVAGRYYADLAVWLGKYLPLGKSTIAIISFLIIFILINRLIGLVVTILDKSFDVLKFIPFLGSFNRLFGAIFGFIEGALVIGLAVTLASRLTWTGQFSTDLANSGVAKIFNGVGSKLLILLPVAIRNLKSLFKN